MSCNIGGGEHRCLASMDSDLEAFSRNPTDGSFAVLAFQLAALTKYLNEVFSRTGIPRIRGGRLDHQLILKR